ncbi:MAG TPA: DUF4169 family protein [Aliidongia sp.]|nr:DUF4169 family protein [Aliidongia sp.]
MGDVVNLNKFRKARNKAKADAQAAENRTRFGRSKEDLTKSRTDTERTQRDLDGKELD